MAEKIILETRGITKYFGGLRAVYNISLKLNEKNILAIIGPNGAGKTTTFNLISGVFPVSSGNIIFEGKDITKTNPAERCHLGIGRTFQIMQPFEDMSVLENITTGALFGRHKYSLKEAKQKSLEIAKRFGLFEYKDFVGSKLPLAYRKKLEIARAYATSPKVMLLDEVMEGLNPAEAREMIETIFSLRDEGISIIMIDHIMFTIKELADWVIVMNYGEKLTEGKYDDVVKSKEVIEAYLGKEETC
ncbi:MAG TPA: ABC transporter ATP-binding protein [Spirochaetota bacterium]|nr:ABC transporter ATP-binding protein [Spirochaetota bacterium]HOM38496.1 ABC transporter ATP-binding protein [Spirochaetota bacterium]HPQ49036.1 ABC transporter ATP-binding protein [Spirochaetota bacterium]